MEGNWIICGKGGGLGAWVGHFDDNKTLKWAEKCP